MSNPNQPSSTNKDAQPTGWESLSEVEFSPVSISTNEISKISLSDSPMGEGREDKRADVADASGMEKRTSNIMLGYNKKGVQVGETYLSLKEFREKALKCLEEDSDEVIFYKRIDTGRRFATPSAVVDDMILAITGVGPEANLSDNSEITNQDARSVEFSGPSGATQRGVFMLGNEGIQMPNGTYAETGTINSVIDNYLKATAKEEDPDPSDDDPDPSDDNPVPPDGRPVPPDGDPVPPDDDPVPSEEMPTPTDEKPVPPDDTPQPPERDPSSKSTPEAESDPDKDLHQATLDLAELYAKSRRLIAGPGVREEFNSARQEYQKLLAEHLSTFGHQEYRASFESFSTGLQSTANELAAQNINELTAFAGGDLSNPNKTPEEMEAKREELRRAAEAKMKEGYPDMVSGLETTVTSKMVEEYTKLRSELEEATIDALDNGTACRQAVSKIITNKWTKRGLVAAAATGLAVATIGIGHGVADGSLAVSLGYTAGGVAAGALRGGLTGALMSRQSSKTSAIRGYGDVKKKTEERIGEGEHITARSLAEEAMSDYGSANKVDTNSNRVKTAVASGAGMLIGGAASGIHVDNVVHTTTTEQIQTGTTPVEYDVDLSKIDIEPGSGMGEVFTDLNGDPSNIQEAVEIAQSLDSQYGMVPGSNGEIAGLNGQVGDFAHTYPGTIDTWPDQARDYITQVTQKWAEAGLIDSTQTGGDPIFTTVEKTVTKLIPNLFYNMLIQAEATAASGVVGSVG